MFKTTNNQYNDLQATLDYNFKDIELLKEALTRRSAIEEKISGYSKNDFQRLEFIGDKVLGLVIGKMLFERYPKSHQGELTKDTSSLVNNSGPLAKVAESIKLGKYILMGRGEEKTNNGRKNIKLLTDHVEALIGAIFLDSNDNYQIVEKFILKQWSNAGLIEIQKEQPSVSKSKEVSSIVTDIASSDEVINLSHSSKDNSASQLLIDQGLFKRKTASNEENLAKKVKTEDSEQEVNQALGINNTYNN